MQIDPIIKEHESPYAWNSNNPVLYADPTGSDSTQRAQAVAMAIQYVLQNCANTYGFIDWQNKGENNVPGPSADMIDCSGLVRASIMATDEGDPYYDGQSHQKGVDKNGIPIWKNGVEILVDNPDFEEIDLDDARCWQRFNS